MSKSILNVPWRLFGCQCPISATQVSNLADATVQLQRLGVSNVADIFTFLPNEPALLQRCLFYLFGRVMALDRGKELFNYEKLFSRIGGKCRGGNPAEILLELVEESGVVREPRSSKSLIESAEEYISQHFTEPITLSQIADSLKVSPNYLSSQFHEGVGESYIKYITRLRMEYAAHLLKSERTEKISSVSELSGYCSLKHFNYVFKEYFGITPGQYQKTFSALP